MNTTVVEAPIVPVAETGAWQPPAHTQGAGVAAPGGSPMALIEMAVRSNADLDKLDRLMELHKRWEEGEATKAFNEAFAGFRSEAVKVIRATPITDGPLKGKKYADLHAFVKASGPVLSQYGLSVSWSIVEDAKDWIRVQCTLRHVRGHSESVVLGGPPDAGGAKNALQARISTVTYLERVTLKAILGLAEQGDDNDGRGGGGGGGGGASEEANEILAGLTRQCLACKTDEQALNLWRTNNARLAEWPAMHDSFKEAVTKHRHHLKIKEQVKEQRGGSQ